MTTTFSARASTKVVILMPVFQGQTDFDQTISSLANLDTPCDVVVVDDGSEPALEVSQVSDHLTIHLMRLEENKGIVGALNAGLQVCLDAGYDYIARMDAGDFARADRLTKQIDYLQHNPNCVLVGSDTEMRDESGTYCFTIEPPRGPKRLAAALHERSWLMHPSIMFRASVFAATSFYTDEFPDAEDYEIVLRLASQYEVGVIPEPLITYIVRKGSISGRNSYRQVRSRLLIQVRYFRWTHWMSYYGFLRSVGLLVMPGSVKGFVKRRFLYPRPFFDKNKNKEGNISSAL